MSRFARLSLAVICVTLLACREQAEEAAEGMAADTAMPGMTVSLADFAGVWNVHAFNDAGDTLTSYQLVATPVAAGWLMIFLGRDPVPSRVVSVAGDSVVLEAGPYESVLRPGVMVTTRSVSRLEGGRLVGTFHARYQTEGSDTTLTGRAEGTRAQ